MKIRLTDLETFKTYVVDDPDKAHDATDKSVARLVLEFNDVITMGKIIGEPIEEARS